MNIIQIPFWHWINLFSLLFPGHHGDFILDKQHFYSISKNWYAASSAPARTPDRQILGSELRVCHNGGRWAVAVCICPAGCFYVVVKPPYRLPIFLCLPTIIAAQDLLQSAEIKTEMNQSQSISINQLIKYFFKTLDWGDWVSWQGETEPQMDRQLWDEALRLIYWLWLRPDRRSAGRGLTDSSLPIVRSGESRAASDHEPPDGNILETQKYIFVHQKY